MRKNMKASTLCDIQTHDDLTVSIAAAIVLRNLTTDQLLTKTVVSTAHRLSWFRRAVRRGRREVSAAANVGQRSPAKDGGERWPADPAGRVV